MHSLEKRGIGTAHSKVILIGEHAVVYGEPAIALPFPRVLATSVVEENHGPILVESKQYTGPLDQIPDRMKGLALCVKETLKELNQSEEDLKISLQSEIPIGRGLGSSAATALAIVRGLASFFQKPLPKDKLLSLGNVAEKYAHGNPSGIDIEAVFHDCPIWFRKGEQPKSVFIQSSFYLVVSDTGEIGNTRLAVNSILEKRETDLLNTERAIKRLGVLTEKAKNALQQGNLEELGKFLNGAQIELQHLGVSDKNIDYLVEIAKKAGALGAKLTGGGRGGCMIALAKEEGQASFIAKALTEAGANKTWFFKVDATNENLFDEWGENIESNS